MGRTAWRFDDCAAFIAVTGIRGLPTQKTEQWAGCCLGSVPVAKWRSGESRHWRRPLLLIITGEVPVPHRAIASLQANGRWKSQKLGVFGFVILVDEASLCWTPNIPGTIYLHLGSWETQGLPPHPTSWWHGRRRWWSPSTPWRLSVWRGGRLSPRCPPWVGIAQCWGEAEPGAGQRSSPLPTRVLFFCFVGLMVWLAGLCVLFLRLWMTAAQVKIQMPYLLC